MRKLILDFDKATPAAEIEKRIDFVADTTQVQLMLTNVYATQRGCHAIVHALAPSMPDLTPMEVVALQLLLGSDPNREAFNFQRARILGNVPAFWQERWNVSYSEKL